MCKICHTTKNTVIWSLMSLGVKPQRVIKGTFFHVGHTAALSWRLPWDGEARINNHKPHLTDWVWGLKKDPITVFEVPPQVLGENLAAFFMHYGQILRATSNNLSGRWSFDIMLNWLAFISISNYLDFCSQKIPVIVISRIPTCWRCLETGHLSPSCPGKKASEPLSTGD